MPMKTPFKSRSPLKTSLFKSGQKFVIFVDIKCFLTQLPYSVRTHAVRRHENTHMFLFIIYRMFMNEFNAGIT